MRTVFASRYVLLLAVCLGVLGATERLWAQDNSGFTYVEIKVVDPNGKPLADVMIDIDLDDMQFPMPTNEDGLISLNVPNQSNSRLRLNIKHEKYVSDTVSWTGGKSIPEKHTIKLETGIPIGGVVHDQKGEPIEGVKILSATPEASTNNVVRLVTSELATTDEQGRWQAQVKDKDNPSMMLKLEHEDCVAQNSFAKLATWEQLKQLDHVLTLSRGIEMRGLVTDSEGEPIPSAIVFLGSSRYVSTSDKDKLTATTDDTGVYRFGNAPPGTQIVTVTARGSAPELQTIQIQEGMQPIDFQLAKGNTIRILVADPDGLPIADAGIAADTWRGNRSLPQEIYRGQTDADGIWENNSMPDDEMLFDVFKRGHMSARNNEFAAGEETHTITMPWPLLVTGKVVDAESGLPIEKFTVVQGIDWGNGQQIYWERYNQKEATNGKYSFEFDEPREGHYVRIEAPGYRPEVSRKLLTEEGEVRVNFELQEGNGPSGKILTPDGKPAAGAELIVATAQEQVSFYNGHAQQHEGQPTAKADEEGKYQLPFLEKGQNIIICRHETGYFQVDGKELAASPDMQLTAWAKVDGTVMQGGQPLADEQVQLSFSQMYVPTVPRVYWTYSAQSDAQGKFSFDQVICEQASLGRIVTIGSTETGPRMSAHTHTEQISPTPGETLEISLGGVGGKIQGQLKIPDDYKASVDWNMALVQLTQQSQTQADGFFKALGRAIGQLSGPQSRPTEPQFRRIYAGNVDDTGKFSIVDIAAGQYQLYVQLYPPMLGEQYNWQQLGRVSKTITIPESGGEKSQEPIDVGELTIKIINPAAQTGGAAAYAVPVAQ